MATARPCLRLPTAPDALVFALLVLTPWLVLAQNAGPAAARAWAIEPQVSLRETFTDNARLQPNGRADAITEASAGIRVASNAGSLRGYVDYSLTGLLHARDSNANELRHSLRSAATGELVPGFAFVDLGASYARQAISAFGSQSPYPGLDNGNQADVATLSIAPRLSGRLGGLVRYDARVSMGMTRAKGSSASDVDSAAASLHFDGGLGSARLLWIADASHATTDYLAGRRTYDDRVRAGLNYHFTGDLRAGITVGRERTDLATLGGESNSTWGAMLDWRPSERTALAATAEKRFFGNAHSLTFSHRTPRTVWTLSDVRDISSAGAQGAAGFGSAYDLFFRQFASSQPDAVQRDIKVRDYLQTNGIDPRATVINGFLASAVTLQRTQAISAAFVGARNTLTLRASANRSRRADALTASFDDLVATSQVRERGVVLDWAHKLTPMSVLSVSGSYQRSEGDLASQKTALKAITATWSSQLGARSTVSAGARHAVFDNSTAPYTENALFGAVRVQY